jgi:ferredoxin
MPKHSVEVDEVACIGCGACTAVCPKFFEMKDTDKGMKAIALLKECDEKDFDSVKEAADVCPVNAIHLTDEEGKKII